MKKVWQGLHVISRLLHYFMISCYYITYLWISIIALQFALRLDQPLQSTSKLCSPLGLQIYGIVLTVCSFVNMFTLTFASMRETISTKSLVVIFVAWTLELVYTIFLLSVGQCSSQNSMSIQTNLFVLDAHCFSQLLAGAFDASARYCKRKNSIATPPAEMDMTHFTTTDFKQ